MFKVLYTITLIDYEPEVGGRRGAKESDGGGELMFSVAVIRI